MYICLDLETTGIDPSHDRIIEVAAVKFDDSGKILDRFVTLVNPGFALPQAITVITGITDSDLKDAPQWQDVKEKVVAFIKGELPIVGHNVSFDRDFLNNHGVATPQATYDTVELARMFFLDEPSYALEILAKNLPLPHRPSHRAMDDVMTTVDLFLLILKKISALEPAVMKQLSGILARTEWPTKRLFLSTAKDFSHIADTAGFAKVSAKKKMAGQLDISQLLQNTIVETQESFELSKLPHDKKTLVAVGTRRSMLERLDNATAIFEPEFYLSRSRFDQLINQPSLSSAEASFAVKITLWLAKTKIGVRQELALGQDEYRLWDHVCALDITDESFFRDALVMTKNASVILCHHAFLISEIFSQISPEHIIVEDALALEDNITQTLTIRVGEEDFTHDKLTEEQKNRIGILFGLIGMYYSKNTDPMYKSDVVIDNTMKFTEDGGKILSMLENLDIDCDALRNLKKIFELASDIDRWVVYVSGYTGSMRLFAVPLGVDEPLCETVLSASGKHTISFIDSALSISGDLSFFKNVIGLDDRFTSHRTPFSLSNLTLDIPSDIPGPNTNGYFSKYIEILKKSMDEFGGATLVLLQTKKALEATYLRLMPEANARSMHLLAQGLSGGRGKVIELFATDPGTTMLIGLQSLLELIEPIEDDLKCVLFQKIPFDFSTNPLFKMRPQRYRNGFEEYTVPRALLRFKKILAELNRGGARKIIILDRRLLERDYARGFLNEIMA
ncbi:MAG: exonuclease domain-containing protein [Patescibacteria group bacterium]